MNIDDQNKELLEEIDAMVFSGDYLLVKENLDMFEEYLGRWSREIVSHREHIERFKFECEECDEKCEELFENGDGEKVCSDCIQKPFEFDYMMLNRLKMDCKYYLGNGNRYNGHLWADTPVEHIAEMKRLYNKLPVKPEWLTLEKIEEFEKEMV